MYRLPSSTEATLDRLDGYLTMTEGITLADYASKVSADHAVVEVGCYKGKSTAWLAAGVSVGPGSNVYAVDLWTQGGQAYTDTIKRYEHPDTYQAFNDQLGRVGLIDHVTAIIGSSQAIAAKWEVLIGLLHIDAEHSYKAVRADIAAWGPYMVPGGVLILHDFSSSFPGVIKAANELLKDHADTWEFEKTRDRLFIARKKATV